MQRVKVYGADWCAATRNVIRQLQHIGVDYEYINIEHNEVARAWVAAQSGGKERKPTVDIGGRVLSEPTQDELSAALQAANLVS